jgi:hypothetical protein
MIVKEKANRPPDKFAYVRDTPSRGYWAKKAAGQRVKKIQLPNRSADELIEIRPNPFND